MVGSFAFRTPFYAIFRAGESVDKGEESDRKVYG
jgi:hypothetical protein